MGVCVWLDRIVKPYVSITVAGCWQARESVGECAATSSDFKEDYLFGAWRKTEAWNIRKPHAAQSALMSGRCICVIIKYSYECWHAVGDSPVCVCLFFLLFFAEDED